MQQHLIQRQIIQIEVSSKADAEFVYALCSEIVAMVLPSLLDKLFSEIVSADKHLRIPKLELKLGTFSKNEIKSELPRKLISQLRVQLRNVLQGKAQQKPVIPQQAGEWESVRYFLTHGQLPWWYSDTTSFNLNQIIQRVGQSPSAVKLFRQQMHRLKPAAWQRLFLQLPKHTAQALIQHLQNGLNNTHQSLIKIWLTHYTFANNIKKKTALQAAILQFCLVSHTGSANAQKQFYRTLAKLSNESENSLRQNLQKAIYQQQWSKQNMDLDATLLLTLTTQRQANLYQNIRWYLQFGLLVPTEQASTIEALTNFIQQKAEQKDSSLKHNVLPLLQKKQVRQRIFNQCTVPTQTALVSLYFPNQNIAAITGLFQLLEQIALKNNLTTSPEHFRTLLHQLSLNWLAQRSTKQVPQLTDLLAFLLKKVAHQHYRSEEDVQQIYSSQFSILSAKQRAILPKSVNNYFERNHPYQVIPQTDFHHSNTPKVTISINKKQELLSNFTERLGYFLNHGFWQEDTITDWSVIENNLLELVAQAHPALRRLLHKSLADTTQMTRFLEQFSPASWRAVLGLLNANSTSNADKQLQILDLFMSNHQQVAVSVQMERMVYRQLLQWAIQPPKSHLIWRNIELMEKIVESLQLTMEQWFDFVQKADYQHYTTIVYLLKLSTLEQFSTGSLATQRQLRNQFTALCEEKDPVFYQQVKQRTSQPTFVKTLIQYVPQDLIEALFFLLWKGKSMDLQREYAAFKTAFLQLYPSYTLAWFETLFKAWQQVYPALDFQRFWSFWLQALAQRTQTNFENFIRSILVTAPYKKIRNSNILVQILDTFDQYQQQLSPPIKEAITQFFNPTKSTTLINVSAYFKEHAQRQVKDVKLVQLLKKILHQKSVIQRLIHQQDSEVLFHLAQILAGKNWIVLQKYFNKKHPENSTHAFAQILREREERLWYIAIIDLFVQQSGKSLPENWQQQLEQNSRVIPNQIEQQIQALVGEIPTTNDTPKLSPTTAKKIVKPEKTAAAKPNDSFKLSSSPSTNRSNHHQVDFLLVLNDYFHLRELPLWSPFKTQQHLEQHLFFAFKKEPIPLTNYLSRWLRITDFRAWFIQQFSAVAIEKVSHVFQMQLPTKIQTQLTRLARQWQLIDVRPLVEVKNFYQQTFLQYYFTQPLHASFSLPEFQTLLLQHFAYQNRLPVAQLVEQVQWVKPQSVKKNDTKNNIPTTSVVLEEWAYWCRFQRLLPTSVFISSVTLEQYLPFKEASSIEVLRRIFLREIHQLDKLEWWFANTEMNTIEQLGQLFIQQQNTLLKRSITTLLQTYTAPIKCSNTLAKTKAFWWQFFKIIITSAPTETFPIASFKKTLAAVFSDPNQLIPSSKSEKYPLTNFIKYLQTTDLKNDISTQELIKLEQAILKEWQAIIKESKNIIQLKKIWQHRDYQFFIKKYFSNEFITKITKIIQLAPIEDELKLEKNAYLSATVIEEIGQFNQLQQLLTEGKTSGDFLQHIDSVVQTLIRNAPLRLLRMLEQLSTKSNYAQRLQIHLKEQTITQILNLITQDRYTIKYQKLTQELEQIAQVFAWKNTELQLTLNKLILGKPQWKISRLLQEVLQVLTKQSTTTFSQEKLAQVYTLSLTSPLQRAVTKWQMTIAGNSVLPAVAEIEANDLAPHQTLPTEAVALLFLLQHRRRAWWDTNTTPIAIRWNQWVQTSPAIATQMLQLLPSPQRRIWLKWFTVETMQHIQPQLLPSIKVWLPKLIIDLEQHWRGEINVSAWTKIMTKAITSHILKNMPASPTQLTPADDLKSPVDFTLLIESIVHALSIPNAQQKIIIQTLKRALQKQWKQWEKELQQRINESAAKTTFTQLLKSNKRQENGKESERTKSKYHSLTMTDLIKIELTALRYFLQNGHLKPSTEQLSKTELEEQLMYHLQKHPDLVRAVLADCFQTAESIERFLQFFSEKAQRKVLEVWAADVPLWSFLATLQQLFSAADSQYPQAARRQTQVFFLLNYLAENTALPSDTTAFVEKWLRYLARQEQLSYVDLLTRLLQPIQSGQLQLEGELMPHLLKLEEGSRTTATERRAAKIQEQTKVAAAELVKLPDEGVVIHNAGLVILASFFYRYFKMLELLDGRKFKDEEAAIRAVHLLQYLVNQQTENAEHLLVFNKILCGVPLATPVPLSIEMTEQEVTVSDQMYHSILANWPKMESTSIENLRASFIIRNGLLVEKEDKWTLQVEPAPYDILLEFLPWTISVITLPWVEKRIEVTWKTRN